MALREVARERVYTGCPLLKWTYHLRTGGELFPPRRFLGAGRQDGGNSPEQTLQGLHLLKLEIRYEQGQKRFKRPPQPSVDLEAFLRDTHAPRPSVHGVPLAGHQTAALQQEEHG